MRVYTLPVHNTAVRPTSRQMDGLRYWFATPHPLSAGGRFIREQVLGTQYDFMSGVWRSTQAEIGSAVFINKTSTNEYVSLGNIECSAPFSISVWAVAYTVNTSTGVCRYAKLLNKATSSNSDPYSIYGIGCGSQNPGVLSFFVSTGAAGTTVSASTDTGLEAYSPFHVVGTYDGSYVRAYWNGTLKGETATTLNVGTSNQPCLLGRLRTAGTTNNFWHGLIGDVRFYNKTLSPDEVWQLWAPETRWELYSPEPRIWALPPGGAPPAGRRRSWATVIGG